MKKYKFTAVMLLVIIIIYVVCNNVMQQAGMILAKHCIQAFARIGMPVYGYVQNLEKNGENAAVRLSDGIYPVNEYARDRYIQQDTSSDIAKSDGREEESKGVSQEDETQDSQASSVPDETNATHQNNGNNTANNGGGQQGQSGEAQSEAQLSAVVSNNVITGMVYPKTDLINYNFILNNFYTVTNITELGSDKLRPEEFLQKDLKITHDASTPQILIFHTHSQETFADSIEGDTSTGIVGVGEYLTRILRDKYGYNVIHDTSVYDYVNGKLDRSKAYTYAEEAVARILQENPSIEVVIDLHRDGVPETTRLVSDINGKKTAKIMFFNGLSYSRVNGDISYLNNPYRDDNLAMSLQMQLLGNAYYPGFLRRIYVNAYRYCLHMRGRSMLIEAGAQNNTVEEVMNAMEPLADILDKELRGEKCW